MSVTFPYSHPEMVKDSYFDYKDTVQVPLGVEVIDYRKEKKGETFVCGVRDFDTPVEADADGCIVNNLIVKDHRPEIEKLYGKPADKLTPPAGYEFTGEYRKGRAGEYVMMHSGYAFKLSQYEDHCRRMILRKTNEVPVTPRTYTAAEVKEKFGESVMSIFGYQNLKDIPGFAFTGRIEKPKFGDWYVFHSGNGNFSAKKWAVTYCSTSYLTLVPTGEPLPRIVSYTLMEASEFFNDEARYLPNENGEMMAVDPKEVPSVHFYERTEAA